MCSIRLGEQLSFAFFNIVAAIVAICVILLWILVVVKTVIEAWKGDIFYGSYVAHKMPEFTVTESRHFGREHIDAGIAV